jgi:rod shape-determining protein MreB and related proteins
MNKWWDLINTSLAFDLGTSNIRIYLKDKGIIIKEPAVLIRRIKRNRQGENKGKILVIGSQAKKMIGRLPRGVEVVRPIKNGVVKDFDALFLMLNHFIKHIFLKKIWFYRIFKPNVLVAIPLDLTAVERQAIEDILSKVGIKKVNFIDQISMAAKGAGLPIEQANGQLVIDLGGGRIEIGVISSGGLSEKIKIDLGGEKLNRLVKEFLRKQYKLLIGENSAEMLKESVGCVFECKKDKKMVVRGRNVVSGLPDSVKIGNREMLKFLKPVISEVIEEVKKILKEIQPELVGDIVKNGIVLTGGGAKLTGLNKLLASELNMEVWLADSPQLCVIRGCGKKLEEKI